MGERGKNPAGFIGYFIVFYRKKIEGTAGVRQWAVRPLASVARGCAVYKNERFRQRKEDEEVRGIAIGDYWLPQHFLYFLPLPQGQGSFRPILGWLRTTGCLVGSLASTKYHWPSCLRKKLSSLCR